MKKAHKISVFIAALLLLLIIACQNSGNANERTTKNSEVNANRLTDNGNEQWRMGNYQEALKYFKQAYKKVKQNGNEQQTATLLNNLGLVHWRLENNTEAMECYTEAATLAEKLKMDRLLGLTCTNHALILKEQRNFIEAFALNKRAITIFKQLGEPRDLAIAYNNQGQIYRYGNQPDAALTNYNLSLAECQKINYTEGMATAYQNLSAVYTQKGNQEKASIIAHRGLALSLKLDSKVRISEAFLELSRIHDKFARPDSALFYFKKYYEKEKELMDATQSEKLSQYQASLGMEVKNLRIKNLQNEQDVAHNRLWAIGAGIVVVLLLMALLLYRYFSKMRFKKQQLEAELDNSRRLIEIKERELKTYIIDVSKKNSIINSLQEDNAKSANANEIDNADMAGLLGQKILTDDDWDKFKSRFNAIYPRFFNRIKESNVSVTEAEVRILVLMRLELNGKDMANILGISPQSVRVCKMRLKKKLAAKNFDTVEDFLESVVRHN